MGFFRLYTGDDGQAHFEDLDLTSIPTDGGDVLTMRLIEGEFPSPAATKEIYFFSGAPGSVWDWHTSDARNIVVVLSGREEITVEDGSTRRTSPGDVCLAEDTTGKGHRSRVVGDEPLVLAIVSLG